MSNQTLSQIRLYELCLIRMTTPHKRVDEGYEYGLVFMQRPFHQVKMLLDQLVKISRKRFPLWSLDARRNGNRRQRCGISGLCAKLRSPFGILNALSTPHGCPISSACSDNFHRCGGALRVPLSTIGTAGKLFHAVDSQPDAV
jgi:hypothetical protein